MLFTDPHRTESKQNAPTRTSANHGIRHSLPVSGDINLVDLGHFSREKNYFSFVFIKFLLPIRNNHIMSCKKTQKYFSVHIHFKLNSGRAHICIFYRLVFCLFSAVVLFLLTENLAPPCLSPRRCINAVGERGRGGGGSCNLAMA